MMFPDLTKVNVPYGLLDRETQDALKAHGGPIECWMGADGWIDYSNPGWWAGEYTYRVKPAPPKLREFHINPDNGGFYELHPEHDPVSLPEGFLHVVQKTTA